MNLTNEQTISTKGNEAPKMISLLMNSICYFIECAFIMEIHSQYRLIVIHRMSILTDTYYPTLKGAKIAFAKIFKHRSWKPEIKTEWTPFYCPDTHWLKIRTSTPNMKEAS